jgi:hypothetical protein
MTNASAVPTTPSAATDSSARRPGISVGAVAIAAGSVITEATRIDTNDVVTEVRPL